MQVAAARTHHRVGLAALGPAVAVDAHQRADGMQVDAALRLGRLAGLEGALAPQLAGHVLAIVEVRPRHFLQLQEVEVVLLRILLLRPLGHWLEIQGTLDAYRLVEQLKIWAVLFRLGDHRLTCRNYWFSLIERASPQILAGSYLGSTAWSNLIEPPHPLGLLIDLPCALPVAHPQLILDGIDQQRLLIELRTIIHQELVLPKNVR